MESLTVDLGDRSYPILIGEALFQKEHLAPYIKGRQVMVVTNETIAPLYLDALKACLTDFQVDAVILPDGEAYKNCDYLMRIYDALLEKRHNRTTTLIALGGGVVGDMTGYAAASYQRGVAFIQCPTTLLSQVDSSVGGKTGVNHPLGKNMIGAFYQPQLVLANMSTFSTLPDRGLSAGLAEVIKYGLIYDLEFLDWLEANMDALMAKDAAALSYAVKRSCEIKAEIVAQDEQETGIRAILNLGHTFGHAIETHQGYGVWLHGEAVAAGTVMAVELSHRLGWVDAEALERTKTILQKAALPIAPPEQMSADDFMSLMAVDKKVLDGRLRLVLLNAVGEATVTSDFDTQVLIDYLNGL